MSHDLIKKMKDVEECVLQLSEKIEEMEVRIRELSKEIDEMKVARDTTCDGECAVESSKEVEQMKDLGRRVEESFNEIHGLKIRLDLEASKRVEISQATLDAVK